MTYWEFDTISMWPVVKNMMIKKNKVANFKSKVLLNLFFWGGGGIPVVSNRDVLLKSWLIERNASPSDNKYSNISFHSICLNIAQYNARNKLGKVLIYWKQGLKFVCCEHHLEPDLLHKVMTHLKCRELSCGLYVNQFVRYGCSHCCVWICTELS